MCNSQSLGVEEIIIPSNLPSYIKIWEIHSIISALLLVPKPYISKKNLDSKMWSLLHFPLASCFSDFMTIFPNEIQNIAVIFVFMLSSVKIPYFFTTYLSGIQTVNWEV